MAKFFINPRTFLAWMFCLPVTCLVAGFLGNYYSTFFSLLVITLVIQSIFGWLVHAWLGKAQDLYTAKPRDFALALSLFMTLFAFTAGMFVMALQFPSLFKAGIVLLERQQVLPFVLGSMLAFPCLAWLPDQNSIKRTSFHQFLYQISAGLLVAGFFFVVYFIFAAIFNQPAFDVDDIFFDSDGLLWRTRFTTDDYHDYYGRSVHPFVLLLLRPLVALVSFFLKGDKLAAAFVLVAFAGALCVFLAWFFVKHITGNSLYAVLIASLLGGSAAHLVFGSLIETYIFLAAVMMTFLVLLLKNAPFITLISVGLVSFGITLTNFVQVVIAYVFVKRDLRQSIKYGAIAAALVIPLAMLNNFIYPGSQPYFFIPSTLAAEADNTFTPSIGRGLAVLRVMFFHSIVAPDPLILEEEIPFLKVWIFKADPMRLSEYQTWPGTALAFFWLGLLLLGGFLFLKNLKTNDDRFPFAFILILLFNFALHLRYGKDLFLYSANWTYALLLLLALSWKELAETRWFQVILMVFISLLLVNNSRLILTMLGTSSLHIK